jgi:hypothetical protein
VTVTPRDQALALVRRCASQFGAGPEAVLGRDRAPAAQLARLAAYHALADAGWQRAKIARLFGRTRAAITIALRTRPAQPLAPAPADETRLAELEEVVRRVSGQSLSHMLRDRLGIQMWIAIVLSIAYEAHPRVVTVEQACLLYEQAAIGLGHGRGGQVSPAMISQAVAKLRQRCAAIGLPDPYRAVRPLALVLTDDMASWIEANAAVKPRLNAL